MLISNKIHYFRNFIVQRYEKVLLFRKEYVTKGKRNNVFHPVSLL